MAIQTSPAGRAISLVRILTGVMFFCEGYLKLTGGFVSGEFARQAAASADKGYVFCRPILRRFILPHPAPFAWAIALGETLLGLALVSGFLVRLASIGGILLVLIIGFGSIRPIPGQPIARDVTAWLAAFAYAGLLLIFAASNAGRTWGLDSRR